jgi:hypothetical protein
MTTPSTPGQLGTAIWLPFVPSVLAWSDDNTAAGLLATGSADGTLRVGTWGSR